MLIIAFYVQNTMKIMLNFMEYLLSLFTRHPPGCLSNAKKTERERW